MKNYLHNMPVLKASKLTTAGVTMLAFGFLCVLIRTVLDGHQIYGVAAMALGGTGFPTLLAGLVCDCLIRIHNAKAHYFNNKD